MSVKRLAPPLVPQPRLEEEDRLSADDAAIAVMRADLEARGVGREFADRVARELATAFSALPPATYERALRGVVAAWEANEGEAAPGRAAPEPPPPVASEAPQRLRELQNLMSGFVGELAKLDEALEVLAAYLRRMRQSAGTGAPSAGDRVLH